MSQPLELNEYRVRARSAADYGNQGFFVTSLITVAEEDVPVLCDEIERLRVALELIGTKCGNYVGSSCVDSDRTPDANYTADRWCDQCIAREALREVSS